MMCDDKSMKPSDAEFHYSARIGSIRDISAQPIHIHIHVADSKQDVNALAEAVAKALGEHARKGVVFHG